MKQEAGTALAIIIIVLSAMPLVVLADAKSSETQPANLKVFTNSSAYAPLQLVQMYANVTYNGAAVVNQDVAFYVKNSNGSVIAIRAAETNDSGVANADFRMPTPDQDSNETNFGTWSVTGSVNVTQTTLSDTATFTFGYLSTISNVQVPASINAGENLPIEITIINISNLTMRSELDITLFDQAQVPIGSATATNTMTTRDETVNATIFIPDRAFTGQATVSTCLLTASGVAIAPERIADFEILSSISTTQSSTISTAQSSIAVSGPVAFVVPEYAYGGLIALAAAFVGFIAFEAFKKAHQHPNMANQ